MMLSKSLVFTVCVVVLLSFVTPGDVFAGHADGITKARGGTVMCGGNNFTRLSGKELQRTSYTLRNYSPATPITIDRVRFFYADGTLLFDSDVSGFPTFGNNILNPLDNILDPNQSTFLNTEDILPFLSRNERPIQLRVDWLADEPVLLLETVIVRQVRKRNASTGKLGRETGRHAYECRTTEIVP